jgi:hypothetical protein
MTARANHSISEPAAAVTCVVDGGCSYLRALSTIEHLAGFEHTAKSYATAAERCQRKGCWAATANGGGRGGATLHASVPIQLYGARKPALYTPPGERMAQTIPFERSRLVDFVSDSEGNYIERRPLKLDTLSRRNDPLGYLYQYWRGLRSETGCQFSNIDTVHLVRAGIIGKLHIIDVADSDPSEFRFELFGYAVPLGRYEKPRSHPVAIYADSVLRDYNTVRLTGVPRLQRIRGRLRDVSHHYTRLILPFLDVHGRVTHLAVAIRQEPGDATKVETGH